MKTESTASKVGKFAFLEVAAVWFGTHVGGGFATGNQTMNFFIKNGWNSLWMPFISILVIALVYRASMINALDHEAYDYRSWAKFMYAPSKIMPVIFEILYLVVACVGISTSIAGGASLMQELGAPYLLGVAVMGALFFVLTIFGAGLIRKASMVMTIVMAVLMLIIYISGIAANTTQLAANFAAHESSSFGETIFTLFQYAGYQSVVCVAVFATCKPLQNRKNVNKTFIAGYALNTIMLFLSILMLFAWKDGLAGTTLPTFTVIKSMGMNWLLVLYSIMLLLAFVSTGVNCAFGCVTRFEKILKVPENMQTRRIVLSIIVIAFCMFVSLAGLTKLVQVGYGYAGIVAIPCVIFPVIIINIIRTKKKQISLPVE